jgi:hypothetical protein
MRRGGKPQAGIQRGGKTEAGMLGDSFVGGQQESTEAGQGCEEGELHCWLLTSQHVCL